MATHLTPEELASVVDMPPGRVIEACLVHGVPIYHGKVDKHLFAEQLRSVGEHMPAHLGLGSLQSAAAVV